ncbi:MAG: hypothetical protein F4Y92_05105 [Dehalococcoidia bacterium]|nr:hypothetical protein [Dehalococcoidia bacterium]
MTEMTAIEAESTKPVSIELELACSESGQWVAIDHLVGEYGEGATCEEAVRDLIGTLYESRELLRERREHLSEHLVQQLAVLEASLPDEMP